MMPALLCTTIVPGARRSTARSLPVITLPSLWCSRALIGACGRGRPGAAVDTPSAQFWRDM